MKLKEILDMSEYLKNRCYCSGEIYSNDGFGYQIFKEDTECKLLDGKCEKYNCIFAIATSEFENADPQLLVIFKNDDNKTIYDITRYDATENNIKLAKEFINGRTEKANFDEFNPGEKEKSLKQIMGIADAIMVD